MRLVVIESPYAATTPEGIELNLRYLRDAMADCFRRGEAPFASHGLYTQPGVLDDTVPEQRSLGIAAGLEWGIRGDAVAFYQDLGMSPGMLAAERRWGKCSARRVEYRTLLEWSSR